MRKSPAKQTTKEVSAEIDPRFAPVMEAFTSKRDVTAGKLMSSVGLKVNGKIFAMYGRGKFIAKLPRSRVDELVGRGKGERFNPGHGRLMREWLALGSHTAEWIGLAHEAYDFVRESASQPKAGAHRAQRHTKTRG